MLEFMAGDRYRALLELASMDKSDFDTVLRRILQIDADVLDLERVNCWELQRNPVAIRCVSGYDRRPRQYNGGATIYQHDCPPYFRALEEDPIILANDAQSDERTRDLAASYLEPHGITSMMDVPIWVRGSLWGVVCHEHVGRRHRWRRRERDFAVSVGHIVSMAVEARERVRAEHVARVSELFVGVVGHDLRSPLATIRASAEYLVRRLTDEACSRAVERILRGSDRITRMVDQLLDFTTIRMGGGLPVRRQEIDLGELCRRAAADTMAARPDRAIDLQVAGDAVGSWDPDRIWQLLANLVQNAIEHGGGRRRIWISIDGTAADRVVLTVRNDGAVPRALVPVIFEPFRQQQPRCHGNGGIGLGLFIAREIATAHAGTIDLDARADETIFTVRLPRWAPDQIVPSAEARPQPS